MVDVAQPRQVAVALIIHSASLKTIPQFLIVASRKHANRFVLPKGGIEKDETSIEAAERESWEEAGLIIGSSMHLAHLTILPDTKPHALSPTKEPENSSYIASTTYAFELFTVNDSKTCLADNWPEKAERTREWVHGWDALLQAICWGRREETMRKAINLARERLGDSMAA